MSDLDFKWIVERVVIPIITLVVGIFSGMKMEKKKKINKIRNTARVSRSKNTSIYQGSHLDVDQK